MSTSDSAPREAQRAPGLGSAPSAVMVAAGGGPLPRLGEVIRDAERLLAQAVDVLARDVDPASEPDVLAWPAASDTMRVHDLLLGEAASHLRVSMSLLAKVAALPMPPAGSAVHFPAHAGEDLGGPPAPGVPDADPSPQGAPAVPGRGVGLGYVGPRQMPDEVRRIATAFGEALMRRST